MDTHHFRHFTWFKGKTNVCAVLRGQNSLCKSVKILKNPILHSIQKFRCRSDFAFGARKPKMAHVNFCSSHGLRAKLMSQLNSEGRIHCARVLRYLKIPSFTLFSIGQNLALGARETQNGYPIFDISHGLRAKLMSVLSSEGSIHEVRVSKLLQYPIIYSVQNVIISVTRLDSTARPKFWIWLLLVAGEN